MADVEEHALGYFAHYPSCFKVDNKQRLFSFNFFWIGTLLFHSSDYPSLMISKVNGKAYKFLGPANILYEFDGPDANVYPI